MARIRFGNFGLIPEDITVSKLDEATGIRYDFNYGLEVVTPETDAVWKLQVWDAVTGDFLLETMMPSKSYWACPFKYYIKYKVRMTSPLGVFEHTMDLHDEVVAFKMAHNTLGDCIAYFSQVIPFVELRKCKARIYAQQWFIDIFKPSYSNFEFVTLQQEESMSQPYATYYLGLFHDPAMTRFWQKVSFKQKGLQHQAAHILGLPDHFDPNPPMVECTAGSQIDGDYIVIASGGSKACKVWNNPLGWDAVISWAKQCGYKVVCIDQAKVIGTPGMFYSRPEGCIDLIGDIPLQDRINTIANAKAFIGMASGLAWLAWCCNVPVVMISGFSRPSAEFYTPYRVYNEYCECLDCWGDENIIFHMHTWEWCPRIDKQMLEVDNRIAQATDASERNELLMKRQELSAKKFTCTFSISAQQVINKLQEALNHDKLD